MSLDPIDQREYLPHVYNFQSLHTPNIHHIVTKILPDTEDFIGYKDMWERYDPTGVLLSYELWADFSSRLIRAIELTLTPSLSDKSDTQQTKILKQMQKELVKREEELIVSFSNGYDVMVSSDDWFLIGTWRATLGVIARSVIDLIKHDMCSDSSHHALEIPTMICLVFETANIRSLYSNTMMSSLYYIAGWHLTACLKADRIRSGKQGDGKLGKAMISLFECGTVDRDKAIDLLTEKVVQTEMFGGLSFVSGSYFNFILKLEYVFVKYLTPLKLAVLGNGLIQRVYHNLCESADIRDEVSAIINNDVDANLLDDLITYLIGTYCRMRGKDFCRQIMATDFSNLGKGVRPTNGSFV